ncbi:MAG TPA: tubulin-like doman-containing protein, partial [Candidatus Defluviicoccus seviourii]|nr:tubulin-like doman-containing protein [Candidatus Defluviicoccus seviourii]
MSANCFATMMELEHCMRASSEPHFVDAWTDELRPRPSILPYDDVFLMDTTNVAGEKTAQIEDVYNMIADILFEDFGSGEFAIRKRSVAVNQRQHKIYPFYAATTEDVGTQTLQYSRAFSSVGQTTIDTKSQVAFDTAFAEASRIMMRKFFGVAGTEKRHVPTADERDRFIASHLFLTPSTFDDYPSHIRSEVPAIFEYHLVNEVLKRPDGSSIEAAMRTAIEDDFVDLAQRVQDHKDWPAELVRLRDLHRRDVDDSVEAGGRAARLRTIEDASRRLREDWIDRERLASVLYGRLDNHDLGGLDYTSELVSQIKHFIDDETQGAKARLAAAVDTYGVAAKLAMEQFERSLTNLGETGGGGILTSRRSMAEAIVRLAKTDLIYHCVYRLRARACQEAIDLLRQVSQFLGDRRGLDDRGEPVWTGLIGEFVTGRQDVAATLSEIDADLRYFAEIRARKDATYLVADESKAAEISLPEDQMTQWAAEAFAGYGGSAKLFPMLRTPEGKVEMINQLRRVAKAKLEPQLANLPPARVVLQQMSELHRRELLNAAISRAIPWVEANLTRMKADFKSDQYTLLISVNGAAEFRRRFEAEIKALVPSMVGEIAINIIESSVVGRIVVYCELSGITLDALNPL